MTFKQRLPYFLGGLTIGIIIVFFFLGKKETSFDYGPNARVLKNIRVKKLIYNTLVLSELKTQKLDTAIISQILKNGDADLANKIKKDSCTSYLIEGVKDLKNISITVTNCQTIATIDEINFK